LDWQDGDVILLENTRFYKMEEKNDKDFSKQLAAPYDMSVSISPALSLSPSCARAQPPMACLSLS
jgi:3-phosphoglycerate kinase